MASRNLNDLLYFAIEGAARAVVAYCDSAASSDSEPHSYAAPAKKAIAQEVSAVAPTIEEAVAPLEDDSSHYPDTVENPEEYGYGFETPDIQSEIVEGVPLNHPIHAEVAELLPGFRAVSAMVENPDFVVTPESVEKAMPVWVAFNALSRYRDDEHFPAILAYVRTYIKPVCFAAMGKEVTK